MYTGGSYGVTGCFDNTERLIHSNVPELDFPVPAGGKKFSLTSPLHVYASYPLHVGMILPFFYHRFLGT